MEPPKRRFTAPLAATFTALAVFGLWKLRVEPTLENVPVDFDVHVFQNQQLPDGTVLRTRYTGLAWVDGMLTMLVGAFMPGVAGREPPVRMQQWYFLIQWFAVVCVWTVEAHLVRNEKRVIRFTTIFALLYQTVGGAFIIPLYCLLCLFPWGEQGRALASGRRLRVSYAGALLPAVLIGYLAPTIAMYFPWDRLSSDSSNLRQIATAVWQPAPMVPNLLMLLFASLGLSRDSVQSPNGAGKGDLEKILRVHVFASLACAAAHVFFVYSCLTSTDPSVSLASVLLPDQSAWRRSLGQGLMYMFQWDFWVCFVSTLLWSWVAVADALRVTGEDVSFARLLGAGFGISLLAVVLGPGAAVSTAWYWIEKRLFQAEVVNASRKRI
ncbi:hypothetical protein B0H63DRAFT_455221 [Podospora didyma]|uniref:Uncharacterized protein n=1 Tax=Podospora didyma TaxID=330526 RepID=A0AAE0K2L1_9PEZI|nr:hypothetical protein B0H63DRAFT_455221 [Podospora didyma]